MKNLFTTAFMFAITASLFSCKKDPVAKSKTDLLTQAAWKQTNSESGTGGVYTSDWSTYEPCEKDNLTTFKKDKTYQTTEGATKCDPTDPDVLDSGNWEFSAGETQLIVNSLAGTIVTLDENNFVFTVDFGGGDMYRASFSH
jgi:hypothetical protein